MGSPSFGLTSNNAPLPIPGAHNPTGTNSGVGFGGSSYPSYPMFGAPNMGTATAPSANAPLFSGSGLAGLSSGFGSNMGDSSFSGNLYNMLGKAYGKGSGQLIGNLLENGMFNPQVAAAFLNAMQPSINRGESSILNAFGAEGSRFGSAAALGLGDFQSQVNLNQQQTLASMFQNAQQEQLQLLEGVLPTIHQERADSGGWIHDLIGGLEIAGGIGAMFVPGLQGAGIGLMGMGAGQIGQGLAPTPGGGNTNGFGMPGMTQLPNLNTGTFGANAPTLSQDWQDEFQRVSMEQSAGNAWGGNSAPFMLPGMNIPAGMN